MLAYVYQKTNKFAKALELYEGILKSKYVLNTSPIDTSVP